MTRSIDNYDNKAVFVYRINEYIYRKISNVRRTLAGNRIVDHSDVVGAAPTTYSFSTWHLASRDSAKPATRWYENLFSAGI